MIAGPWSQSAGPLVCRELATAAFEDHLAQLLPVEILGAKRHPQLPSLTIWPRACHAGHSAPCDLLAQSESSSGGYNVLWEKLGYIFLSGLQA